MYKHVCVCVWMCILKKATSVQSAVVRDSEKIVCSSVCGSICCGVCYKVRLINTPLNVTLTRFNFFWVCLLWYV